jgi:hypothetical protein
MWFPSEYCAHFNLTLAICLKFVFIEILDKLITYINVRLLYLVIYSNGMTSCQSSSAENVSCNVVPFFYHHSVVIQHLVSDSDFRHFNLTLAICLKFVFIEILDKLITYL